MDCRTFHKKLEDYLQEGLDFSARFGMERHAQQCIRCGKAMAEAQELRRMVLEIKRVKAPADFESSLLDKIRMSKSSGSWSALRRFWIYGMDWSSWRRPALAASSLAVLALGIVFALHLADRKQPAVLPLIAVRPEKTESAARLAAARPAPAVNTQEAMASAPEAPAPRVMKTRPSPPARPVNEVPVAAAVMARDPHPKEPELFEDPEAMEMEYVEFMLSGQNNRPMPVRYLPRKIRIQYRPASEQYFIQNVSH